MRSGTEFRWILEGFTPDRLPMSRLAEYMQQLAKFLGQEASVHFVRIESNCVALISEVEPKATGRVDARVAAVNDGTGAADAMAAYRAINRMLCEDDTVARMKRGSATIIRFPGARQERRDVVEVFDTGSVVGHLYQLSGTKSEIRARIHPENGNVVHCTAAYEHRDVLRTSLFETVRVTGAGIWRREETGGWNAQSLTIETIERVSTESLRDAVRRLRSLEVAWPDDPLKYLAELNEEGGKVQ